MRSKPERLNLAIARHCPVSCSGCYTYFGASEPDLAAFMSSAAAFVDLGIEKVTVSGGDPLTIESLPRFLHSLRLVGVRSIKVDTVGVGLASGSPGRLAGRRTGLDALLSAVDFLGVPLDGWSNESVLTFRLGRLALYSETVTLLGALDRLCETPKVIINTVVHRANARDLHQIAAEVLRHPAICHWNLFQYTATDQAKPGANSRFRLEDAEFEGVCTNLLSGLVGVKSAHPMPTIEFHSNRARLGQYLLINSDGEAWLPDEEGKTVHLGKVLGAERRVLALWAEVVNVMLDRVQHTGGVPCHRTG
jgi:MoaA/NifB/PqqE/SkfB family radical SAM enzyme